MVEAVLAHFRELTPKFGSRKVMQLHCKFLVPPPPPPHKKSYNVPYSGNVLLDTVLCTRRIN
jgi:hypothetical protein